MANQNGPSGKKASASREHILSKLEAGDPSFTEGYSHLLEFWLQKKSVEPEQKERTRRLLDAEEA